MSGKNSTKTQAGSTDSFEYSYKKATVGKYKIVKEISRGGMGIVFESFQEELKRKVAIKVLPLSACHSASSAERFKREALTVARIRHSGVAQVFDSGKDENCYFIVMEYVEGETLEKKMRLKSVSLDEAIDIVKKVALILSDLHKKAILHRDIKPSNIMLKKDGSIVLLDFGISKCLDDESMHKLTHEPIGTPAYMPPEFIRSSGRASDERSDIYSLGVMLYEIATGTLPFGDETLSYYEIIEKILKAEFSYPRKINSQISKELDTIILKCMAREPEDRYGSARAFYDDLELYSLKKPIKSKRSLVLFRYLKTYYYIALKIIFTAVIIILSFVFVNMFLDSSRINVMDQEIVWKNILVFADFQKSLRVFKGIEGEIEVKAKEQFVSLDIPKRSITWLRNAPGYILLNDSYPGDIKISFKTSPLKKGESFGLYINSDGGVSGYILRIEKDNLSICRNYYENIIKTYKVNNSAENGRYIFERVGAELNVIYNDANVLHFIDYNPIVGEKSNTFGFFFNKGFRKLNDLDVFAPRQGLMVSPLILGQRFYELGQFENAIKEYEKIIVEYPEENVSLIARFKVGMSFKKLGKLKKAVEIFDEIIQTEKGTDIISEVYFQKGICLFLMGNEEWAEDIFLKTSTEFKKPDVTLNIFMFLYDMLNSNMQKDISVSDISRIEKRYRFMMDHFSYQRPLLTTNTRTFINILIKNRMFKKALYNIELLSYYFPNHAATLAWGGIKKGEIYFSQKDHENAEKAFIAVIKNYHGLTVYEAQAKIKLADLYFEQKKYTKAQELYKNILHDYSEQREFTKEANLKIKRLESIISKTEKEN
ncbi:MAG: protein kinase [Candidatus Aureabacteria bacterium]|nr:protein kinase [Candidatus Auribacterota bacterium]